MTVVSKLVRRCGSFQVETCNACDAARTGKTVLVDFTYQQAQPCTGVLSAATISSNRIIFRLIDCLTFAVLIPVLGVAILWTVSIWQKNAKDMSLAILLSRLVRQKSSWSMVLPRVARARQASCYNRKPRLERGDQNPVAREDIPSLGSGFGSHS